MWCIFHVVTPRILDAGGCETPAIFAAAVRTIISGRRLDELQFLWFFVALAFVKIVVDKSPDVAVSKSDLFIANEP